MSDINALWTARNYYDVTPSDSTDLATPCRALMINVGGTIRLTRQDGTVVNLTVPSGLFPGYVVRVHATGTTATGITALV